MGTYSCLACWDEQTQKVEVISSPAGRTMPSWVAFTPQGKMVGSSAKAQVASNPKNTVYDAKRIIGRSYQDPIVKEECNAFPFTVEEGEGLGEPKICVEWRGSTKKIEPRGNQCHGTARAQGCRGA